MRDLSGARYQLKDSFTFAVDGKGWGSEDRRYKGNCGELLAFFGFLELG
jgi:hypothetical protein